MRGARALPREDGHGPGARTLDGRGPPQHDGAAGGWFQGAGAPLVAQACHGCQGHQEEGAAQADADQGRGGHCKEKKVRERSYIAPRNYFVLSDTSPYVMLRHAHSRNANPFLPS